MRKHGHWSKYPVVAWWDARYRVCLICGQVRRNWGQVPLIHKGKKARK